MLQTTNLLKEAVRLKFNASCATYNHVATIQKIVADDLINFLQQNIEQRYLPNNILDIGCGTGFVTDRLLLSYPYSHYLLNDFADQIIENVKIKYSSYNNISFIIADAESYPFSRQNLTVSSLAFQWFDHLPDTLTKLFSGADILAFSTLYNGTFNAWSEMYEQAGYSAPTFSYLTTESLKNYCHALNPREAYFQNKSYRVTAPDALSFARYLKLLGANVNANTFKNSSTCNSAKPLRTIINNYNHPFDVEYKVFFAILKR